MQSSPLANLSLQQLKQAISIRERIEVLEKELSRIIGGGSPGVTKAPRKKRRLSAAARAKISARMKKLGKSYGNISVWFHTTGKAVKEIKKVAPGKFAWAS